MLPLALVRQYAVGQQIDLAVADQEIVLHYVLALLHAEGLIGPRPGSATNGPLLFKGGTALRKCVFGSTGRFSQDVDLDATHHNGFEAEIEAAFAAHDPYHGIRFAVPNFRYSQDENFSGTVHRAAMQPAPSMPGQHGALPSVVLTTHDDKPLLWRDDCTAAAVQSWETVLLISTRK